MGLAKGIPKIKLAKELCDETLQINHKQKCITFHFLHKMPSKEAKKQQWENKREGILGVVWIYSFL